MIPISLFSLCGMRDELLKLGEQPVPVEKPERKPTHPLLTAGMRLGGYGAGVLAGYGGLKGIRHLVERRTGRPMISNPVVSEAVNLGIPLLSGALSPLAFQIAQDNAFRRMRSDMARRRKSGQ